LQAARAATSQGAGKAVAAAACARAGHLAWVCNHVHQGQLVGKVPREEVSDVHRRHPARLGETPEAVYIASAFNAYARTYAALPGLPLPQGDAAMNCTDFVYLCLVSTGLLSRATVGEILAAAERGGTWDPVWQSLGFDASRPIDVRLKPGDIVFASDAGAFDHAALYVGGGLAAHLSSSSNAGRVALTPLSALPAVTGSTRLTYTPLAEALRRARLPHGPGRDKPVSWLPGLLPASS
ncbi:MAG TPA: hypothetical protein VFH51_08830, partial [Myxococcota bacterium]|nr:hypothetical protein [Myxococcota bacterium]